MAAKTLVRSGGASLINRLLNLSKNSLLPQNPNTTPRLFPPIYFPNSDAFDSSHFVSTQGSFSPFALPSLRFFLPNADELEEPMLLFPKRTFQPSLIRRKRNHGFFARKATKGGRKVIARRVAKGRARITA